jgi:hypothetical protein
MLAICLPPGVNSSREANSAPSRRLRAANFHYCFGRQFLVRPSRVGQGAAIGQAATPASELLWRSTAFWLNMGVSPMSAARICYAISREIVGRMKENGRSQYCIVFDPRPGANSAATNRTPLGERSSNSPLVEKPRLLPGASGGTAS